MFVVVFRRLFYDCARGTTVVDCAVALALSRDDATLVDSANRCARR
jgi:hypothetical protein